MRRLPQLPAAAPAAEELRRLGEEPSRAGSRSRKSSSCSATASLKLTSKRRGNGARLPDSVRRMRRARRATKRSTRSGASTRRSRRTLAERLRRAEAGGRARIRAGVPAEAADGPLVRRDAPRRAARAQDGQHRHAGPRDDRGPRRGPEMKEAEDVKRASETVEAVRAQSRALESRARRGDAGRSPRRSIAPVDSNGCTLSPKRGQVLVQLRRARLDPAELQPDVDPR